MKNRAKEALAFLKIPFPVKILSSAEIFREIVIFHCAVISNTERDSQLRYIVTLRQLSKFVKIFFFVKKRKKGNFNNLTSTEKIVL